MLSGPELKESKTEKNSRDVEGEKNDICQRFHLWLSLVAHLLFSSHKKTAGWHDVHLSLKAQAQKCADEQVVDTFVCLWICLCHDTR